MDTYGWDAVFATTIDESNKSLAAGASKLLPSFSHNEPDYSVKGEFGTWQIVAGGSGKLLHLEIAVKSGTITLGSTIADLAGCSAVFEIALQLIPVASNEKTLQFNFKGVGTKLGGDPSQGLVTYTGIANDPSGKLTFAQKALFPVGIANSLVAQANAIAHIFATLDLVPPGANSWLAPVEADYCCAYPVGSTVGYLVILTVVTKRDISKLARKFDPSILPTGDNACMAISGDMFLQHVIEPSLPAMYGHGTKANTFNFNAAYHQIQSTGTFATDKVKSGLIWYQPYIHGLTILNTGAALKTTLHGSCDLGLNINMTFMIQSTNAMSFNSGTKDITFKKDSKPVAHHDQSIPWYDYFLGPIPDILMAIIIPLITNGIATGLNKGGNLTLAKEPPLTVKWPGMTGFTVKSAGLSTGFYMSGDQS